MIDEPLRQPMPLRAFLEAGRDPASVGFPAWKTFQDELLNIVDRSYDAAALRELGTIPRTLATRALAGLPLFASLGMPIRASRIDAAWGSMQHFVIAMSWSADLYDDPSLVELVIQLMTTAECEEMAGFLDEVRAG